MHRWILTVMLLCCLGLGAGFVQAEDPTFDVSFGFASLQQGQVGVVTLAGNDVAGGRARFLNRLIEFYEDEAGQWHGLLAINMEQKADTYPVEVFVWFEDGANATWNGEVVIEAANFIRQDVTVGSDLGYLLEPEVDRAERARLSAIFSNVTTTYYWDEGGFSKPLASDFTSPFGAWRLYNESLWGRHTGVDLTGPAGTPLMAPAAGRVVLAEKLDVRGNYVLIDHGWGVYSGIAHLTEIHVTRGQMVQQGQIIGVSGSTGRSSGPHIHWEMAVNGEWIDPQQFIELTLP